MPSQGIMDRLKQGEVLLMDGGTGSELQRRGAEVLIGATPDALGPWSATANVDAMDVVQQIHADYLRVGADILVSNNFWTGATRMATGGLEGRWRQYARAGGENAVKARDAMNTEAYVTAGMSTPWVAQLQGNDESDVKLMGKSSLRDEFTEHSKAIAETGVDVMLPEYIGHVDECVAAVEGAVQTGLPVFLGIRQIRADGTMASGETIQDLVAALKGSKVDAILLMCCDPPSVSAGLPKLRDAFDGVIGAYPNIGYQPLEGLKGADAGEIYGTVPHSPSQLAELAGEWVEMGAQIVGGCCATGPEHIMAMRDVVKGS